MSVFVEDDIQTLLTHPNVLSARDGISFTVPLTDTARTSLETRFGIPIPDTIPMRWMKGDTHAHRDRGESKFKHTYLVYLTDSPGKLLIDGEEHPIRKNTGFMFNEGVPHETVDTGDVRRLLVGPFNEMGKPVGAPGIVYYSNVNDIPGGTSIGYSGFTLQTVGGISNWTISTYNWESGMSPTNQTYTAGNVLINFEERSYYVYPAPTPTTNGVSRSAPLQNIASCSPCEPKRIIQFSSASEVAEYKRRSIATQYYNNPENIFPIKNRYASMVTNYKGAVSQGVPSAASTCCPGNLSARSDGKDGAFFLHKKYCPN